MTSSPSARASRSIQSIEIGFEIVRAIEAKSKPLTLGEIARAVDMPGGSVHPYLVSLSKVGLVRQEAATGRYGLGPYAVQLGLAGIRQLDVFEAAKPILTDLRDEWHFFWLEGRTIKHLQPIGIDIGIGIGVRPCSIVADFQ